MVSKVSDALALIQSGHPYRHFGPINEVKVHCYFFEVDADSYYLREIEGETLTLVRQRPLPCVDLDQIELKQEG
jgi:hypothetical protein